MLGRFISHRTHRFNRASLRTVSNSQKASGIQISQSVSAIVDAEQGATRSLHPAHRGISVITPLPLGEGKGEGPLLALNAVCSVLLCFSVRKRTHPHKSKTLNISTGIVKIFRLSCPFLFIERLSMKQEEALLRSRTCPSCTLKTPFLKQERHVLERYL